MTVAIPAASQDFVQRLLVEAIIQEMICRHGLLMVFVLMVANGIVSGPPSELVLALGGVLASASDYGFTSVLIAGVSGNVLGAMILYLVGRWIGLDRFLRASCRLDAAFAGRLPTVIFPKKRVLEGMMSFFREHGALWFGVFRCCPVLRSIISLPAGMARVPVPIFLFWSLNGITVWALLWMGLGYTMAESWKRLSTSVYIVLLVGFTVALCYLVRSLVRHLHAFGVDGD